jgi:hypothetical protein
VTGKQRLSKPPHLNDACLALESGFLVYLFATVLEQFEESVAAG